MSSASTSRDGGAVGRMRSIASTLAAENQNLRAEIMKALIMMKKIAVDLERDHESAKVKELESAVAELVASYEDCGYQASAIESVGNTYQTRSELTDFKKLLEPEFKKFKSNSSHDSQSLMFLRQFREAVWNVHHKGQPMPGEEQEDVIMTSTQSNLLNMVCPLSGKPVTELTQPVRSVDCKHVYEKRAVMQHIANTRGQAQCAIAGCPKILRAEKLMCDPLLVVEIDEMRSLSRQAARTNIEDFTALDDDEEEN